MEQVSHCPGDGQFRCILYQKGVPKNIGGIELGAGLTMSIDEHILLAPDPKYHQRQQQQHHFRLPPQGGGLGPGSNPEMRQARKISFRLLSCYLLNKYDGEWAIEEIINSQTGQISTLLRYNVHVQAKKIVPVSLLESKMHGDAIVNLKGIQQAAMNVAHARALREQNKDESIQVGQQQQSKTSPHLTQKSFPPKPDLLPPREGNMLPLRNNRMADHKTNGRINNVYSDPKLFELEKILHAETNKERSKKQLMQMSQSGWELDETMAVYLKP